MPRNLSVSNPKQGSSASSSTRSQVLTPSEPTNLPQTNNDLKTTKKSANGNTLSPEQQAPAITAQPDPDPDPFPLPTPLDGDLLRETTPEEAAQSRTIDIKTSHIVAICLVLGFLSGAFTTLLFFHPAHPNQETALTPAALPKPEEATQVSLLQQTVKQQNEVILKLKQTARTRIGLPLQTVDPQNPQHTTYTPQDTSIAIQWISKASSDITWLSNAPLDPGILTALNNRKQHQCTDSVTDSRQPGDSRESIKCASRRVQRVPKPLHPLG
jgi:hypothetical protein